MKNMELSLNNIPIICQLKHLNIDTTNKNWVIIPLTAHKAMLKFGHKAELNNLEKTILALFEAGETSATRLSEILQMDKKFIFYLLYKLEEKGVLNGRKHYMPQKNYELKLGYYFRDATSNAIFDNFILNEQINFLGKLKNKNEKIYNLKRFNISAKVVEQHIQYEENLHTSIDDAVTDIDSIRVYALTYIESKITKSPIESSFSLNILMKGDEK